MRLSLYALILGFCLNSWAQDDNSLLWEISGNGLPQTSYLYGTMHVSKKIAFRLDDVFYEALEAAEVVALESDPASWLEQDTQADNNTGFHTKGFYTHAFSFKPPNRKDLASFLATEDGLVNNLLYRTDQTAQDFEEETYLDMFIYQAGSKMGKPVLALEELEESNILVGRASMNAVKSKPDAWLQEKMQELDLMSLMQDAYRQRNIRLLDSIDRAMYTPHYLDNMLYIRNLNMCRRLDSAIRKRKVFAGIGAAHLPGESGVIALLRQKGYTVTPLLSEATEKGKSLKEKFEASFREHPLTPQSPDDGFFEISLPAKLYPVAEYQHTTYLSPDLTNGSYLIVHRIPTYDKLFSLPPTTLEDLEELLFENIPGTILSKSRIQVQQYKGLDIHNQLKNGDHQRYQIFITPLEILVFKMAGEGNYVRDISSKIFATLNFSPYTERYQQISSGFRDFEIEMPATFRFTNRYRAGNRLVEGYDIRDNQYYFLKKASLNDFEFLEEDDFELRQIHKRFYQLLELEGQYEPVKGNSLRSAASLDSINTNYLYLKAVINGGDYYLLGARCKDKKDADRYFNSFNLREPDFEEDFKQIRDTALYFSTLSPVKPNPFVEDSQSGRNWKTGRREYDSYTKKTVYQHKNNQAITVSVSKGHDLLTFPSPDSLWLLRKKQYLKDSFVLYHENAYKDAEGNPVLDLVLTDTGSTRGIRIRNLVKGGLLYELKTATRLSKSDSRFTREFFDNFRPLDTVIGQDLFRDKTDMFFSALRQQDSLVHKGYRYVNFNTGHADSLMSVLRDVDFGEDKKHIKLYLLKELCLLHSPRVTAFLKEYYTKAYHDASAQAVILQSIAEKKDAESVKLLLSLLAEDVPLLTSDSEIKKIFLPFHESLEAGQYLFPDLLEYRNIPEYQTAVMSLMAKLYTEGYLKPGRYARYKEGLEQDAHRLLKRQLGIENKPKKNGPKLSRNERELTKLLEDYLTVLYPFSGKKDLQTFFNRLYEVESATIQTSHVALRAQNSNPIPFGLIDSLAWDIDSRLPLYQRLRQVEREEMFPNVCKEPQALAEAALFLDSRYDYDRDELVYLGEKEIFVGWESFRAFYFKVKKVMDFNPNYKMHLVVYPNEIPADGMPVYQNDGFRMEDTDTDTEAMEYVTEAFLLKDRKRASVYQPNNYGGYSYYGY